jgi:hypothetical protein
VGSGGLFALLAAGFLGGCASSAALYPAPTAGQMAAADSAVQVARQDGSTNDVNAARHLRFAEQQLATAKKSAAVEDNRTAALMLARAQADAELALALSRKAKAESDATEAERVLEETKATTVSTTPSTTTPATPSPVSTPTPASEPTPSPTPTPSPSSTPSPTSTPPTSTPPPSAPPRSSLPGAPERTPTTQP